MRTILLLIAMNGLFSFTAPNQKPSKDIEYVLICDSKTAYAYHKDYKNVSDYCAGLKRCSHKIKRITKADAIKKAGKSACKKCW